MVTPGVYVPRPQTESLAELARERVPAGGLAVDLCTGTGAVALITGAVAATDIDPRAVACARFNGVNALEGDLYEPLPGQLRGRLDVITANAPYVPTAAIDLLPRDVREHEPLVALDGGTDGLAVVRRIITDAPAWLRRGGWLLFEMGGPQLEAAAEALEAAGFDDFAAWLDVDGDARFIEARLA